MISDIAWDFDGTLCDSYPHITHSFLNALKECGIRPSVQEVRSQVVTTVPEAIAYFQEKYHADPLFLASAFKKYNEMPDFERVTPFPDVERALCTVMQKGGRNHLYTHRSGASTLAYLDHFHLTGYFTLLFTSDKGFPRKPDPSALLALMARGKIKPEEMMMVGDRPIDIEAAYNAHAFGCFFNSNHLPVPEHAFWSVDTYAQFILLLNEAMS